MKRVASQIISPVPVQIRRKLDAQTQWGELDKEAVSEPVYSSPITILAQVKWLDKERLRAELYGLNPEARGYLVADRMEVKRKGGIKIGDLISKIGDEAVRLYVIDITESIGANDSIVRISFADRRPS